MSWHATNSLSIYPRNYGYPGFSNSPPPKNNTAKNILAHVSIDLLLWQCEFWFWEHFWYFSLIISLLHFLVLFMEILLVECWATPDFLIFVLLSRWFHQLSYSDHLLSFCITFYIFYITSFYINGNFTINCFTLISKSS